MASGGNYMLYPHVRCHGMWLAVLMAIVLVFKIESVSGSRSEDTIKRLGDSLNELYKIPINLRNPQLCEEFVSIVQNEDAALWRCSSLFNKTQFLHLAEWCARSGKIENSSIPDFLWTCDLNPKYTNIFGQQRVLEYVDSFSQSDFANWSNFEYDFALFGNDSDYDDILKYVMLHQYEVTNIEGDYTISVAITDILGKGLGFLISTVRFTDSLYFAYGIMFLSVISFFGFYVFEFRFTLVAIGVVVFMLIWDAFKPQIPTELSVVAIASVFFSVLASLHLSNGYKIDKGLFHPFVYVFIESLLICVMSMQRYSSLFYWETSNIPFSLAALLVMLLVIMFYLSRDDDSTLMTSVLIFSSVLSQFIYYVIMQINSSGAFERVSPIARYYALFLQTIYASTPLKVKFHAVHSILVSILQRSFDFEEDYNSGSLVTVILVIFLFVLIYVFSLFFKSYFAYSLSISPNDQVDRIVAPWVQIIVGVLRYVIEVITCVFGVCGNTLHGEVQRFNIGDSSFCGFVYMVSSYMYICMMLRKFSQGLVASVAIYVICYVLLLLVSSDRVDKYTSPRFGLLNRRKNEQREMGSATILEKFAMISQGDMYVHHSFPPSNTIDLALLQSIRSYVLPLKTDFGEGSCIAIGRSRFISVLHMFVDRLSESNISTIVSKNIVGQRVTIGDSQCVVRRLVVPCQDVNIPDRLVAIDVDKDVAASYLKKDQVGSFSAAKNVVLYSKRKGDGRDGRCLGTDGRDVLTHNISAVNSDSGGLIAYLSGLAIGIHSGVRENARQCCGFRLDTTFSDLVSENRILPATSRMSILEFSKLKTKDNVGPGGLVVTSTFVDGNENETIIEDQPALIEDDRRRPTRDRDYNDRPSGGYDRRRTYDRRPDDRNNYRR